MAEWLRQTTVSQGYGMYSSWSGGHGCEPQFCRTWGVFSTFF